MELRELTCIGCPMGCAVQVELEQGRVKSVTGQSCKRGEIYARTEVVSPKRILTSTVRLEGGGVVSVKTKEPILKEQLFVCVKALKNIVVQPPVHIGEVIVKNIENTGVDVVATRRVL